MLQGEVFCCSLGNYFSHGTLPVKRYSVAKVNFGYIDTTLNNFNVIHMERFAIILQ
jgi:hypothetical protein